MHRSDRRDADAPTGLSTDERLPGAGATDFQVSNTDSQLSNDGAAAPPPRKDAPDARRVHMRGSRLARLAWRTVPALVLAAGALIVAGLVATKPELAQSPTEERVWPVEAVAAFLKI